MLHSLSGVTIKYILLCSLFVFDLVGFLSGTYFRHCFCIQLLDALVWVYLWTCYIVSTVMSGWLWDMEAAVSHIDHVTQWKASHDPELDHNLYFEEPCSRGTNKSRNKCIDAVCRHVILEKDVLDTDITYKTCSCILVPSIKYTVQYLHVCTQITTDRKSSW